MNNHLPECPLSDPVCNSPWNFDGTHLEVKGGCMRPKCEKPCICDWLRACEQRVIAEDEQSQIAYKTGYADGLDAAETAVAEALKERMLMADCSPNTMRAPLLAIRSLKEKE